VREEGNAGAKCDYKIAEGREREMKRKQKQ